MEFSKATVAAETHAYHKLMGPETNGKVRGVGNGVALGKLRGRRICQSGMRTSDSNMMGLLLKEVQTLRKEVADLSLDRVKQKLVPNSFFPFVFMLSEIE